MGSGISILVFQPDKKSKNPPISGHKKRITNLTIVTSRVSSDVLKDASTDDLIRATRTIASGGAWLDPAITNKVIDHYRRLHPQRKESGAAADSLTAREQEVLLLIAEGLTNREIAEQLVVSEATVKTHISHIFSKLGARDRAAAIVYAYDHGIVIPRQ